MLQYIINTSAIWLLGLIVFDLFMRREANHGYNRFYLLVILFAGILIPLWSWDNDSVIYATDVSRPIAEQSAIARETIVAVSENSILGWEQWLMIIYITGVAVVSIYLLRDLLNIVRLYRNGVHSKDGTWTIIETGKPQSPFSAFRYVFISSKHSYTEEELQMILAHEEQHGHLLHFVDVLLIRLINILFWFNPLIYILERRLLMVHEYQADAAVSTTPSAYGQFLVEQSILGSAPVLAHSFTRSPLKKRILMLTRKTTTLAKSKQLLLLPVLAIAILSFTKNAFTWEEPQRDGNKVTYKGNTIVFSEASAPDTVMVQDPRTDEIRMVISRIDPKPLTLNGEDIFIDDQHDLTETEDVKSKLNDKINNILSDVSQNGEIPTGSYNYYINHLIVDKNGNIVYMEPFKKVLIPINVYDINGKDITPQPLTDELNTRITNAIIKEFETSKVATLTINNVTRVYCFDLKGDFTAQ
ncbi:MAG: M56 family metallopeptidase [Chitinophagales bacterium]|nr:M56 family metallopeptidase [Chitinophagales bacterium]